MVYQRFILHLPRSLRSHLTLLGQGLSCYRSLTHKARNPLAESEPFIEDYIFNVLDMANQPGAT